MNKRSISLYHSAYSSPLGTINIGMTKRGLCCLAWNDNSWRGFLRTLEVHFTIKIAQDDSKFDVIKHDLDRYFDGELNGFSVPVDLIALTPFQQKVLEETRNITFGTVRSYHDLAAAVGCPDASRAVGNALGKNPVPIVIPCHRVIKTNGTLGGFTGGLKIKRYLLDLENTGVLENNA